MSNAIYTVGTSNRIIEQFIGLLKRYNIEVVLDVRSFPTSRHGLCRKTPLEMPSQIYHV